MTERQRQFREQYKADISPLYNGLLHITVIYGVSIAALYWAIQRLHNVTWEWALILPVFLAGNFVEWFMHRYIMHRRIDVFALRAIYER
ncbi:fatty acid hydroxylase family protein, partial [Paraburkholderia sp. SIMBA_050]